MSEPLTVYALCVLVLFAKMLGISCYQGFFRLRHLAFTNLEDAGFFQRATSQQELPQVRRAARAWANDLENIPLFFVLGGLCVALGTASSASAWLFCTFTAARVMHTLLYLGARQPWRTLAYAVGVCCLLGLAGLVAGKAVAR
ncbi:MAPEG family protein [Pseudomonas fontis]|uniref:Microsomal glutathione S-transferase 1 n=1 Tax=Pseudomonas fontis TaxID=2942633 RepID=A0ABT5NQA9_9PSED|nr:MAPEG family protein [Pseudomonas fontis]MDD0975006.1 MAPEG family protein [Pseudomonas fontis]MDD0990346.1 MAPEG family protein [Pseudomonas fontis]